MATTILTGELLKTIKFIMEKIKETPIENSYGMKMKLILKLTAMTKNIIQDKQAVWHYMNCIDAVIQCEDDILETLYSTI